MNVCIRFPCPRCKEGHISSRQFLDLATDKVRLSYECNKCGYTLEDYVK